MGFDTMVEPNTYWWGRAKLTPEDGPLTTQIADDITEQLRDNEQDTVRSDDGARELRVQVTVTLVPVETCQACKGTGTIGVVIRLGDGREEDVPCPKCNGEGRI